ALAHLVAERVLGRAWVAAAGEDQDVVASALRAHQIAQVKLGTTDRVGRIGVGDVKDAHGRDTLPRGSGCSFRPCRGGTGLAGWFGISTENARGGGRGRAQNTQAGPPQREPRWSGRQWAAASD